MRTDILSINAVTALSWEGSIAVLSIDSPPVNTLSLAVREGLLAGLENALENPETAAVVLCCQGRTFFSGADIGEFGKPFQHPTLWDVLDAIEGASKPVIAAMHGTVLGGGLEVALACHYRVATSSCRCGLPEVKLGILPAGGGTQRLPRLIGVESAIDMIVGGDAINGGTALKRGLIDALASEEDLHQDAIAFARQLVAQGGALRRARDDDSKLSTADQIPALINQYKSVNARKIAGLDAPQACLDAIEASCTLSFDEGLALERRLFDTLVASPQAAARRHVFFAERKAAQIPGIGADVKAMPVGSVGVIGGGTMGRGIAICFLNAGFPVTLVETSGEALERALGAIRATYASQVQRGRLDAAEADQRAARVTGALALSDLSSCDLVVEAVFEDMGVKQTLFAQLGGLMKADAILATNTSFLDVDAIAAATGRPHMVVGLHFFSPANVMRLLEVVRGAATDDRVLVTAMAVGRKLGKLAVLVGNCHGFVGNRILAARQREAERLMLEGVTPWDIDRVHTDFGMPMGPFAMYDLAGLDLGWSAETSRGETVIELLCEAGRRGQKSGAGFYDYDEKRRGRPSPATEEIIAAVAAAKGVQPCPASDAEIWARCAYPMINEAAHILEENMASRASDIDLIWINGYGWPAQTGGPLFYADMVGLDRIVTSLSAMEVRYGADFAPAPLLERLAREGRGFATL
ncbi:MAG: 3-hydroxyacyl-CoA dehydrogenase NAD-binding domain-containing protein [Sphingobium sp.]|uniref:3-hydroxyacyl-CoA dehydrogenase NAD-binding domain-containing protein n=1 Tax=Sphingobium sp. TaxID=1912891 RepID=UPI0029ACA1B1|nr:3-hydroxyacyl-CoA dehydrogenase NAD-binding domain-containing protein [Sphingobium sp.]MDX3909557.1 3-hydroxyacyl-CoA dehydrogenase NAD-binding domain-containing protein [Sphingobium sp.]